MNVVDGDASGALEPRAPDLRGFYLRPHDRGDAVGDAILELEHVLDTAIEILRPQMCAGRGVDELGGYPELAARPSKAALEHVANAELLRDLRTSTARPL